ncbi:expansin-A31-like [Phragmites australis]|uniref:expansin-A31-like n=1 Tax=Phragmites australis TaxID=29695 RepID=UPI002D796C13|nr:expansin-A31-like [Phragmites australis]
MEMAAKSLVLCTVLAVCLAVAAADWSPGTATFYGGPDGSGTMDGACGYGNLYNAGYGVNNAALSETLFNDGASCGQCYLIMCDTSKSTSCKPGNTITVTATNMCPANYVLPNGGWCGPGRPHFDMSQPAWENIGIYKAGVIPVLYQRVQCSRSGGVRFSLAGSKYFLLVNIQNIGGSGSVGAAWVKGTETGWIQMSRNWGANWQALSGLVGQALSFAVTSTGGQYLQFPDVVPAWWQFGQTFTATKQQFTY